MPISLCTLLRPLLHLIFLCIPPKRSLILPAPLGPYTHLLYQQLISLLYGCDHTLRTSALPPHYTPPESLDIPINPPYDTTITTWLIPSHSFQRLLQNAVHAPWSSKFWLPYHRFLHTRCEVKKYSLSFLWSSTLPTIDIPFYKTARLTPQTMQFAPILPPQCVHSGSYGGGSPQSYMITKIHSDL